MVLSISCHPVTERALVDTQIACDLGDGTRRLDHHLHGLLTILRRELAILPHNDPFSPGVILPFWSLSGERYTPQRIHAVRLGSWRVSLAVRSLTWWIRVKATSRGDPGAIWLSP